jgi:acetylornithine deacetylase
MVTSFDRGLYRSFRRGLYRKFMTPIEKLLIKLLKIPSVSGQEKEIGQFLIAELGGFTIKKQPVEKDRFNIIAEKGKAQVYIVVHVDTVPGEVPLKITKDKIFGRGAIDNKGNIAGAIMAAKKLENIGLIFTVGEEVDFAGAKKLKMKNGKYIIMEPTRMKVMTGQRGLIIFDVVAMGHQKHSSLAFKKEDSAVYNLLNIMSELYEKNWTAFNAIISDGGEQNNIISPYAKASASIRPKSIVEYERTLLYLKGLKRKKIKINILGTFPPCFSTLAGFTKKAEIASYFSEMIFFKNSILFGVGNIKNAHTIDEFVLRKDLNKLEDNLKRLIKKL